MKVNLIKWLLGFLLLGQIPVKAASIPNSDIFVFPDSSKILIIGEKSHPAGQVAVVFACTNNGEYNLFLVSRDKLLDEYSRDNKYYPTIVYRYATSVPEVLETTLADWKDGSGNDVFLIKEIIPTQVMLDLQLEEGKDLYLVAFIRGQPPITYRFSAKGFSDGMKILNNCE